MGKAETTRSRILNEAVQLGSLVGLEGLTLGRLAEQLRLSKSGLYAHFESKEDLQVKVIQAAAAQFVKSVIEPSVRQARGEPRVIALFEHWLGWQRGDQQPGGCLFVAASTELDDRAGPVRDELVRVQLGWLDVLARAIRIAQDEGHYDRCLDAEQLAFELHGLMLSYHHQARLLRAPDALSRAHAAFAAFRQRARGPQGESPRYRELLKLGGIADATLTMSSLEDLSSIPESP